MNERISEVPLHFMIPGSINELAGGYIYDKEIIASLKDMGCEIMLHQVPDDFPHPEESSKDECREVLRNIPDGGMIVVDGLVGGAIGDLIREYSERLVIVSLIHLPLAETPWTGQRTNRCLLKSERTALHSSHAIIVTSEFALTALQAPPYRCRKENIFVVEPGWHRTERKKSYKQLPLKLLCVANIIERKGHATLIDALGELADRDWRLTCCGNMKYEPVTVRNLIKKIEEHGLKERISFKGPVKGRELVNEYLSADLFVFPSWYETYGMALTEASGYGLPIVTSVAPATNSRLSRESALFFPPGDNAALRDLLKSLMNNKNRYGTLCSEAKKYLPETPSWNECADAFLRILTCAEKMKTPV